jgi:hypothetical protein
MTFYIFEKTADDYVFMERVDGSVKTARAAISSDTYAPGRFLILADTSGDVVKTVVESKKVSVDFKPTRKRRAAAS